MSRDRSGEIVFARANNWLPKAFREGEGLRLEIVGGANALHDPREFDIPLREDQLAVIEADLARHLILWSALQPLCYAAGTRGPIDQRAAAALLDPILLAGAAETNAFLRKTRWERDLLVSHGADIPLLERGRVVESMRAASEWPDWKRAEEYGAQRRRAERGVVLSPLDEAILRFTGQYVHGSTVPRRIPDAVEPALLPEVLNVIATAEQASAGMRIALDPSRGRTATDPEDWRRMEEAVEAALRSARPALADDAVRSVRFLMCAEAADRARKEPPADGSAPKRKRGRRS